MNSSEQTSALFILKSGNFKITGYQNKQTKNYLLPFPKAKCHCYNCLSQFIVTS